MKVYTTIKELASVCKDSGKDRKMIALCKFLFLFVFGGSIYYGIEIFKTKYKGDEIFTEKAEINNITSDENTIEMLLEILKRNEVTPVSAEEVIQDLFH